jgi:hypothetical protein
LTKLAATKRYKYYHFCVLYYKHVTIVNDASSGINKLKASLNDAARGVIYECHMFLVKATAYNCHANVRDNYEKSAPTWSQCYKTIQR